MFEELESRPCSQEELLGESPESNFYESNPNSVSDIVRYGPKMRCPVKQKELALWGNYDTTEAQNIMIVFEKCDPDLSPVPCKNETEINEWLVFKYFVVMTNQKKFVSHRFDEAKI